MNVAVQTIPDCAKQMLEHDLVNRDITIEQLRNDNDTLVGKIQELRTSQQE